jgi:Mlc titration factor MtfA (ptsG expression regulator)
MPAVAFFVVVVLVGLLVAWLAGEPLWIEWRRASIRRRPFPAAWREILRRRMPYFRALPVDLQLQLKRHIQVFLAEKPFIGCRGLAITDEIRVTVAAQACLLLLNRRRPHYYPELRQILVYPGAFLVDRVQTDGAIVQDQRQALSGESWSQGQVILSWDDTVDGAAVADDGRNVVIHEFAHQLDQQTGHANGAPALPTRARYERWSRVFNEAFERLRDDVAQGRASLFNPYGATNPAEFFAVASEVFFEQPQRLAADSPALFDELARFYRINPLSW